jgi:hypothetical protein
LCLIVILYLFLNIKIMALDFYIYVVRYSKAMRFKCIRYVPF